MKKSRRTAFTLLLSCTLLLALTLSSAAGAATLGEVADTFSDIGEALRGADNAREQYSRYRTGSEAARYEQAWREQEYRLEEARISRMAKESKLSEAAIREMRERGRSWDDIARAHRLDVSRFGYGHKSSDGWDRDNDRNFYHNYYKEHPGKARGHYTGTPQGPPGQYKKAEGHGRHDDGPGKGKGKGKDKGKNKHK